MSRRGPKAAPELPADNIALELARKVDDLADPLGTRKLVKALQNPLADAIRSPVADLARSPLSNLAISQFSNLGATYDFSKFQAAFSSGIAERLAAAGFGRAFDLQRGIESRYGIGGLDALRSSIDTIVGSSSILSAAESFMRIRDSLGTRLGADYASRFDVLGAKAVLPSIDLLARARPSEPTAIMTLLAPDDLLGSIVWLAPRAADASDDDASVVSVAAFHAKPPPDSGAWPRLRVAPGSAITCKYCGTSLPLTVDLFLSSADEAFFQGEMLPTCPTCSDEGGAASDDDWPPYEIIKGGDEGDGQRSGELFVVVDNTRRPRPGGR